jgi:type I restriction enzyme S subunit
MGEVLIRSKDEIEIDELTTYQRLTVRLNGRGIVVRDKVPGAIIGTKKQFIARAGQLVLSKIDARNGAFGILPPNGDLAIITGNFWAFDHRPDRLSLPFLEYLTKTPAFLDFCVQASEGTTNRRYLQEDKFLAEEIPLPPVVKQRRLVERIDALAAKIDEAKQLRRDADHATEALMAAHTLDIFEELANSHPVRSFAEFEPHVTSGPRSWGHRTVDFGDRFYRAQDILSRGKLATSGKVFIESPDTSQGMGAKLKPGDLMIVITGATVGRVAVYPSDSEPGYVSQHVAICRIDPAHLDPRFALRGLLSPYGQEQILGQRYGQGKPGLNLTNIRNLRLPVPPLPVQKREVEYLDHLEERSRRLTSQQAESKEQIEAMLPAILDWAFRGELR